MFWSFHENAGSLSHMLKGWHRAIFHIPVTRHFDALAQKTDRIRLLLDDDQKPVGCKSCGYAIARLIYADGWEVEACSAITAPKLVGNKEFEQWVETMPQHRITSDVR